MTTPEVAAEAHRGAESVGDDHGDDHVPGFEGDSLAWGAPPAPERQVVRWAKADHMSADWKGLRSLAEITAIETAYRYGVPCLGRAAAELLLRWRHNLRDSETLIRLVFLAWFQRCEPPHLTGLQEELPTPEDLNHEAGGDSALDPEARFVVGYLATLFPYALGAGPHWEERAQALLADVAATVPTSLLFASWQILFDKDAPIQGRRLKLNAETRARFAGRGALGDYLVHAITSASDAAYRRGDAPDGT